ncbi:MAG: AgmX/PglI C-terminal domain-containing protein [Myxococcaceae bacterium]
MASDALDRSELKFIRTSPFSSIDWRFGVILGVSIATHLAFALHLSHQPLPAWSEIADADRPMTRVSLPPLLKLPKPPKTASAKVQGSSPQAPHQAKKAERDLSKFGLLAPLTSHGPKGAFDDLVNESNGVSVKEAFAGASNVKVATVNDQMPEAKTVGSHVETIGRFGADRAGEVKLGDHRDSQVLGHVIEDSPPEAPGLDQKALMKFLAARRAAVQYCYERELKHSPSLAGRIVVRLTVTPNGRTEDVEIEENTMNSDAVGRCVRNLVSGWVLPVRPEQDSPLSIPYIFTKAN